MRPEHRLLRQFVQIAVAVGFIQSFFLSPDCESEPSWLKTDLISGAIFKVPPCREHRAPGGPNAVPV
jgi:hypothetical protein